MSSIDNCPLCIITFRERSSDLKICRTQSTSCNRSSNEDQLVVMMDTGNYRIRKVDTNGIITTVAGDGGVGFSGDGVAATNTGLGFPYNMMVNSEGDLLIADSGDRALLIRDRALLIRDRALLIRDRALLIRDRAILIRDRAILIRDRAILIRDRAILIRDRAILIRDRAILIRDRAILIRDRAILIRDRAMLLRDRPLLIDRRAILLRH